MDATKYDLTRTHAQFLDLHLILPIIEFVQQRELYRSEDMMVAKLELLERTNMVDFMGDEYAKLHGEPPKGLNDRKKATIARLNELNVTVKPILAALEELHKNSPNVEPNMEILKEKYHITEEQVEWLYECANFLFSIATYEDAGDYLQQYRLLTTNSTRELSALWGHFATEILVQHWDGALEDLQRLRTIIEERTFVSPLVQVQQRAWLIHWSLFVFFNHPNGRLGIIDMFMQDRYLNTIQTLCPHILRYLTAAVITSTRRKEMVDTLVSIIHQEKYTYSDPITEFVECLYVDFDFEKARQKLRECEAVLQNDFFLVACRDEFVENARLSIFETYCRIHRCIDLKNLAEELDLKFDEAERWIVNLIRNSHLDAKIDSQAKHVIMSTHNTNVHQQILSLTHNLLLKTNYMDRVVPKP